MAPAAILPTLLATPQLHPQLMPTLVHHVRTAEGGRRPRRPENTDGRSRPSTTYIGGSGAGRRRELRRRSANSINKLIKSASER